MVRFRVNEFAIDKSMIMIEKVLNDHLVDCNY